MIEYTEGLVSVVIPCFNAERWIEEAIESCLRQTYKPIEIVAVDDGSEDRTLTILEKYKARIHIESCEHNGGSAARNLGAARSTGEFIQFLDADDYLLPNKIEEQVEFLRQTDADVVYGDWRHLSHRADGKTTLSPISFPCPYGDILEGLLAGWWTANLTLLLRRQTVIQSGGWDEALQVGQDRDFFISVALTGATIGYQTGCHSIYRRYGYATVSTGNRRRWLISHRYILEKVEKKLVAAGRLDRRYQNALASSYFVLARVYFDIDRNIYKQLLHKALQLNPSFSPAESVTYNVAQKCLGFYVADLLASVFRKRRRKRIRPPQLFTMDK